MFPPKNILFPVDFSDRCRGGGRLVEIFAGHFEAEITMLHVVEPPTYSDIAIDTTPAAEAELARYMSEEMKHFTVRRVLTHGDAASRIADYANSGRFDLVMMPTHGYGGFRRLMLGSVTARVLDHVNCPVCTGVHMEDVPVLEKIQMRNVLCAVDLGTQSCAALSMAARMAEDFSATLTIAHALEAATAAAAGGGGAAHDPDWRVEVTRDVKKRIADLQESTGTQSAHVIIGAGDPPRVVHEASEETHADLVVIGRSVRQGVLGRLRANAYSIVRQSPCPVLSV